MVLTIHRVASGADPSPRLWMRRCDVSDASHRSHGPRIHERKKIESLERINSIREANGSFDPCYACRYIHKWLGTGRLREETKFIRSELSKFSAHVSGVIHGRPHDDGLEVIEFYVGEQQ